jgi:glycosyltransferase involved in cell wall biosynthesis
MKIKPKVSVIIPVYNTESYVREAVESIMHQTLHEIEIIIVNDGSTDHSASVLKELVSQDNRIQIYTQQNQGQSVARNKAMEYACGEYLYFMDSDDLLDENALKSCYDRCELEYLDFVLFDALVINEYDNANFNMDYHHSCSDIRIYNGLELLDLQLENNRLIVSPCLIFARRSYMQNIKLDFYPGIIHEDQLFIVMLYIKALRVGYISQEFFKRRIRKNSTMTKQISWSDVKGYFTVFIELLSYFKTETEQVKSVINKYISITLNAFAFNAHEMTLLNKMKMGAILLRSGWIRYIDLKNLIRFLLP